MIFKQIPEILNGYKTQTRRVVKPNEWLRRDPKGVVADAVLISDEPGKGPARVKWQVGSTYAVQPGRGENALHYQDQHAERVIVEPSEESVPLRITITAIRREHLKDISEDDALAEGVKPRHNEAGVMVKSARDAYKELWNSIHRSEKHWHKNPLVWVLEFQVNDPPPKVSAKDRSLQTLVDRIDELEAEVKSYRQLIFEVTQMPEGDPAEAGAKLRKRLIEHNSKDEFYVQDDCVVGKHENVLYDAGETISPRERGLLAMAYNSGAQTYTEACEMFEELKLWLRVSDAYTHMRRIQDAVENAESYDHDDSDLMKDILIGVKLDIHNALEDLIG